MVSNRTRPSLECPPSNVLRFRGSKSVSGGKEEIGGLEGRDTFSQVGRSIVPSSGFLIIVGARAGRGQCLINIL